MKKLAMLLVLVLATSTMFADINDNTSAASKIGTGTFKCKVLTALGVAVSSAEVDLGTFVVSSEKYDLTQNNSITFTVSGEKATGGYSFWYKIAEDESDDVADLTINWKDGNDNVLTPAATPTGTEKTSTTAKLGATTGTFTIVATVADVKAKTSGSASFVQTVTVSYNQF